MEYIQTESTEWGVKVQINASGDRTVSITGFDQEYVQMRGMLFYSLDKRCDNGCPWDENRVPAEVKEMGNAGVASYRFAVHGDGYKGTAHELDVTVETVRQYLSDFKQGRR